MVNEKQEALAKQYVSSYNFSDAHEVLLAIQNLLANHALATPQESEGVIKRLIAVYLDMYVEPANP
jgi:hypothetical protein